MAGSHICVLSDRGQRSLEVQTVKEYLLGIKRRQGSGSGEVPSLGWGGVGDDSAGGRVIVAVLRLQSSSQVRKG